MASNRHLTADRAEAARLLAVWERDFRAAARADNGAILRAHLRRLGLPTKPKLLLEGTIRVVQACAGYATIDNQGERFLAFLKMQNYNPSEAAGAPYALTFDLFEKAFARLFIGPELQPVDLADLYGSPWEDYELVGFSRLWISSSSWGRLKNQELRKLEEQVTCDLRYDYSEDELSFWFDSSHKSFLLVTVQDVSDPDDRGEA